MKFVILILSFTLSSAYEYWINQYTAFTSNTIVDNEGWWVQGNSGQLTSFCNGVSLFGGFNTFGIGAIVSKIISLPPHFKIRVSLEFWKIDSWDNEVVYFIFDDYVQTGTWYWNTGDTICGNPEEPTNWREVKTNYAFEFSHQESTLVAIITTNLNESPYTESWGFRNFQVEIQICAPGCLICNNDTPDKCWYYEQVEMNWFDNFQFDGWTLDNQLFYATSSCTNIQIIGGVNSIIGSKQLSKQYNNLSAHYEIILQVQLWKFDSWINNQFQIIIDGDVCGQAVFNQIGITQLCGDSNGGEQLLNIRLERTHTSNNLQIRMKSDIVSTNGSWGLRAFRLFLVKCYQTCLVCSGPNPNDCSVCKTGYFLHNSECVDGKWVLGLAEYFKPSDFQQQSGWTISNVFNNQSPFQICSNINLLGGYSLLAKDAQIALAYDLPKHKKIRIKLEFWKFGNWDNEWFKVFANGIQVYQVQFGKNGALVTCGSNNIEAYIKNLDFEFNHVDPNINLVMTTSLDEVAVDESWAIRCFQLFYEVSNDCTNSIIDNNYMPAFLGTKYIQSTQYSFDKTLQNQIEIFELGISLYTSFDQYITVSSALKKLTIQTTWQCFLKDLTLTISILQNSYPDYKTGTAFCKYKQSNIVKSVLTIERIILQESQIKLLATSTSFQIFQIVEGQTIKLYEMKII